MTQFVFANNVSTQLAAAATSTQNTLTLASAVNLPTLSAGQIMPLTLNDAATGLIFETVYVTAISGATLTVSRAQEGTSAYAWNIGDYAECGPTAGTMGAMLQTSGGNMTGAINEALAPAVASAASPDIWSGAGNSLHITGSTAITGFAAAPQAGARRTLVFDGIVTLTNGANLILPGGANLTTAAGDSCVVLAETTTRFRIVSYTRADGTPLVSMAGTPPAFTASVASSTLTGALGAGQYYFRNASLGAGGSVAASAPASLSLTIPSGATLGAVSGQQSTFVWAILYNGGSPVLAVANLSGGLDMSETGLISTTAISASSTSASVWYSSAAVANSPYRIIGVTQQTEVTAGTYATAPSLVQPVFGAAFSSLAVASETYHPFSMVAGTTYYNTTGKEIKLVINLTNGGSWNAANIGGFPLGPLGTSNVPISYPIPAGASFNFSFTTTTQACYLVY